MSQPDRILPGDTPHSKMIEQMIRVDHAGEYGAKRIYEGQLAILGNSKSGGVIRHMAEQEEIHLQTFEDLVNEREVRPTALMPIWHIAGFALGATTALMGEKAAMACTVAVESVIGEHYGNQAEKLGQEEASLKQTITQFRDEELEHHDTGLAHGAEETPFYAALRHTIETGTRCAIWLSTRV